MADLRGGDCGSTFVHDVLAQHPGLFSDLLADASRFRFQVLLSVPDSSTLPGLTRHGFRVDYEYFYPASAIKLCAAVAAMQKLQRLRSSLGVDHVKCITPLALYSLFEGMEDDRSDPSNINENQITIAHEIRKIFLVSDNHAFNQLFSFVGHRTINQAMWDLGLQSTRLHHRLSETRSGAENLYSEPIEISMADTVFTLPPKHSELILQDNSALPGVKVGTAYITEDGRLVHQPMDFSQKNCMSMMDLQDLLTKLLRPDIGVETPVLGLDAAMRLLLMEAMAQYPCQSTNPKYDGSDYPDDYCKFFLPGLSRIRPKGALRIYNKIGRAYGFTIDNSYVFDVETGRSFFLTAAIYTNANGVLNDDQYEYEFADQILADLAEVLGRALWQIPDSSATSSSLLDCTPSSLWPICTKPCSESSVNTQDTEESNLPTKKKTPGVEQLLTELMLASSAEDQSLSLHQPHIQGVPHQLTSNIVAPEEGSLPSTVTEQSNSVSSPLLQHGPDKLPVQTDTTNLPHSYYSGHVLPIATTQLSTLEVVSSSTCANVSKNRLKPCYRYFLDE